MSPDNERGRPAKAASPDEHHSGGYVTPTNVPRWSPGCPCGCRTRLPWIDDPECVRHQPVSFDLELYEHMGAVA